MLKKILSWFSSTNDKNPPKASKNESPRKSNKRTVGSSRIGELGEYKIIIQLDQLPKDTKYLSDIMISNPKSRSGYSQIDHIVVSPFGLFVIETKNYNGDIKGSRSDKYWRVSNRFNMYNPLKQNFGHIKALESILSGFPGLHYVSMISFTMRCRFNVDPELRRIDSNELIVYDTELSEFINRKIQRIKATSNRPLLTEAEVQNIYETLSNLNITDPLIRAEHIAKLSKGNSK